MGVNMKCFNAVLCGAFFIAATTLPVQKAKADKYPIWLTGKALVQSCNQNNFKQQNDSWKFCEVYTEGVWSGIEYGLGIGYGIGTHPKDPNIDFSIINLCPPSNISVKQFALVITKYLYGNPEKLDEPNAVLILNALKQNYPCPKGKG